ncbi:amidohydrolase family protein [uncultured Imperialibacter sp.]|uniref:amidohydrolase family protein n=1 Tax=uncultured Imperialibacter sp. TaxID=1672639 RepID=UPI0030DC51F3|tara:strand:- start:6249 stop:7631 length:1383 start_codon:yes stop_codon:yes gene_type:complete
MKPLKFTFLLLFVVIISGCVSDPDVGDGYDFAITNANIITMTSDKVVTGQVVYVKDGVIQKIVNEKHFMPSQAATIIDAKEAYLVPGLTEMHAHIPQPGPGPDKTLETLFLYLSQGVTTIRGMLGHPEHLKLREQVMAGEILGPRIFTSGPSFNGNSVPTGASAVKLVKEQKEMGYDFMKLHPGIKLAVFDSMVTAAKEVGQTYSGHVSVFVGIRHALEAGYGTVDHVDGYVEGLVPDTLGLDPESNGFFGVDWVPYADMSLLDELIQKTLDNKVAIVPTQSLFDRWISTKSADVLLAEPEMIFMSQQTRANWKRSKENFLSGPTFSAANANRLNEIRKVMIKKMHEAGVPIILGSDAPQVFNVPGFSAHHELKSMIDCGLTPYEALKAGTVNSAVFFNQKGKFGEVSEGASADLVLVKANPLDDIANMKKIQWVMVRGKLLDRQFIDGELAKIAALYKE